MSTTQKDIASKLNLSRSLVAGILNERPGIRASEATRRRILHAAREMQYQPNSAAKSLRTGKTYVVACVCRSAQNDQAHILYSGVIERLAEGLGAIGYRLMVSVQPDAEAVRDALTQMATTRSCDAVILWNDEDRVEEQGEHLAEFGLPFVAKGRHEMRHPDWPQIDFGHEALMSSATNHLAAIGHNRIAYLGGDGSRVYVERLLQGYSEAMLRLSGKSPNPQWIAALPLSDIRSVERQMRIWLDMPESSRPTALVIGGNNAAWWGAERGLRRVGRKLGFDAGDLAAAGMAWGGDILHFGEGLKFEDISQNYLAEQMVARVLVPMLRGDGLENPVVRVVPPLCRLGRMDIDSYYREQLTAMEMWPSTSV